MNSMTGYGFCEMTFEEMQISVEIKSVNNRFLDVFVSIPQYLNALELNIKNLISQKIFRGKVDVNIRVKNDSNKNIKVQIDENAAKSFFDAFSKIAVAVGKSPDSVPLSLILSQDGVFSSSRDYDTNEYWKKIQPVFEKALLEFVQSREREGENLKKDILKKLSELENCATFFSHWQPKMEVAFREIIEKRFKELVGDAVDENRILSEVALLLVRYTINEEIIRLKSHILAMKNEIETNLAPGKRLDFLCQEANREINTIGSKNQFSEVSAMVVNAKDALENIREQAKNVE